MGEFELDRIIESNPGVDRKLLDESRKVMEELQRMGWRPEGYSLALPGTVMATPRRNSELSLEASPASRSPVADDDAKNSPHGP